MGACDVMINVWQASKRRRSSSDESKESNVPKKRVYEGMTTMQVVMEMMQDREKMSVDDLLSEANASSAANKKITRGELDAALASLDNENKIMLYDNMVHKVWMYIYISGTLLSAKFGITFVWFGGQQHR